MAQTVTQQTLTLAPRDTGGAFGAEWNRIAAGRGVQADIYSSHAWFDGWVGALHDEAEILVPAVVDGERPVALLPLVRQGWVWHSAGLRTAPRTRVVLADVEPDPATIAALVDQVGRSGVRELSLYRLPTRDPATGALIRALREDGWRVSVTPRSTDNVFSVEDNAELARGLRKMATSARSRERRITPYWSLEVQQFGGPGRRPLPEGLAMFDVIQERSWKGPSRPGTRRQRAAFMRAADELDWVRLSVLVLDGRPVAANSFFRIGDVAIGLSTAYEQRLAAMSPGFILHQHVHQEIYGVHPPRLMDMLPGKSPFKDSLAAERPPLVTVDAHRPATVRGATFGVRRWGRHDLPRAWSRVRGDVESRVRETVRRPRREDAATQTPAQRIVQPDETDTATVRELSVGTALRRYLAVVRGEASAEAVAQSWGEHDRWWLVEGHGRALLRTGSGRPVPVLDLVPLAEGTRVDEAVGAVAATIGAPVSVDAGLPATATADDLPPLAWTPALLEDGATTA